MKDDSVQHKWQVLTEVPAVVRILTDEETMEFAILENLQREDLTPIEEAEAYQI